MIPRHFHAAAEAATELADSLEEALCTPEDIAAIDPRRLKEFCEVVVEAYEKWNALKES